MAPPASETHPKVKKQLLLAKILSAATSALLLGVGVAFLLPYISQNRSPEPWLLALVCLVLLGGLVGFRQLLKKALLTPLHRAEELMREVAPKPMLLASAGMVEIKGIVAALYEPDTPREILEQTRPTALISLQSGRKGLPNLKRGIPVNIYARHNSSDRFLVVETEKHVLWGSLSTRETRDKGWRIMQRVLWGMAFMMLALLAGFLLLQQQIANRVTQDMELARQSAEWPTVQGVVQESHIKSVRISRGKGTVPGFEAVVRYAYQAGGRSYKSGHIHYCNEPGSKPAGAQHIVDNFPVGVGVTVAYNPARPSEAVLYPGYSEACEAELQGLGQITVIISVMCGVLLAVFGGIFFFQGLQRKKFQERAERWGMP